MNRLLLACFALCTFALWGCERNIDLKIPNAKRIIVVNGHIEPNGYAYVSLTWDKAFFESLDTGTTALLKYIITDAQVIVSDGIQTDTLKPGLFYDNNTPYTYLGQTIKGQPGKHYTLTINYKGYKLQATTTMPALTPLDSVYTKPKEFIKDSLDKDLRELWVKYNDPDTPGNSVRVFQRRNSQDFYLSNIYDAFNDDLINGQPISFMLNRPEDLSTRSDTTERARRRERYYSVGDTIYGKWCTIDKDAYNFYTTLQNSEGNTGNPFASPVIITTNIKSLSGSVGKGTGVWCALGTTTFGPIYVK